MTLIGSSLFAYVVKYYDVENLNVNGDKPHIYSYVFLNKMKNLLYYNTQYSLRNIFSSFIFLNAQYMNVLKSNRNKYKSELNRHAEQKKEKKIILILPEY